MHSVSLIAMSGDSEAGSDHDLVKGGMWFGESVPISLESEIWEINENFSFHL